MKPITASQNFYDAAEIEFGKYHQVVIELQIQAFIPNILKTNLRLRRFQIKRIPVRRKFVVNRLRNVNEEVIMHIICGQPNIEIENRETKGIFIQRLRENSSHIILSDDLNKNKYTLIPPNNDSLVTFEIMKIEVQLNEEVRKSSKKEEAYEFTSNTKDIRRNQSFPWRTITLKEVREKLVFIDAEFARTVDNKSVPVSVVILDYDGKRLLDTICCPREKIMNYKTKYYGLK